MLSNNPQTHTQSHTHRHFLTRILHVNNIMVTVTIVGVVVEWMTGCGAISQSVSHLLTGCETVRTTYSKRLCWEQKTWQKYKTLHYFISWQLFWHSYIRLYVIIAWQHRKIKEVALVHILNHLHLSEVVSLQTEESFSAHFFFNQLDEAGSVIGYLISFSDYTTSCSCGCCSVG